MSIIPQNDSPFDLITGEDGRWSARSLQHLMGYSRWENLAPALNRAVASARNQGLNIEDHFLRCQEVAGGSGPAREDFRLTRHAAYLLAMNGDPNKREVADAQAYFAVKTREAEVAPAFPDLTTPQGVLALATQFQRTAEQLVEADRRLKELEPKALAHDTFLSAQDGDVLVRQAAKLMGWQEKHLRQLLVEERMIYRRQATCGQDQWDFYAAHRDHFRAIEKMVEHGWGSCAHYTLYVRPAGVALVQKRIAKRQSEMAAAIEGGAR